MTEENKSVEGDLPAETGGTPPSTPDKGSDTLNDGLLDIDPKDKGEDPKDKATDKDPELYDTQTGNLREDVVLDKIKEFQKKDGNYEKQIKDLRRIISKGKAPEDVKDYQTYEPDSKYEKFWHFDEEQNPVVKEVSDELDDLSKNLGFNVEQNKKVKDFLNMAMEKAGVFDLRTEEQIKLERADWKKEAKGIIGEDADEILSGLKQYITSNNLFSEDEKNSLLKNADGDPNLVTALHKFKRLFVGQDQVPLKGVVSDGVPDQMTLRAEYDNSNTSSQRRIEILKINRKVYGTTLPLLKK